MPIPLFQRRCFVLGVALVAGFSGLSYALFRVQLTHPKKYPAKTAAANTRTTTLRAQRGLLVDRNNKILVRNVPVAAVVADKFVLADGLLAALGLAHDRVSRTKDWETLDAAAQRKRVMAERKRILAELDEDEITAKHLQLAVSLLAQPMGLRCDELRNLIENSDKDDVTLVKELPAGTAEMLETLLEEHWVHGFRFERAYRREYTEPNLATHVVGYTDSENRGRFGVEAGMDSCLTGRDGYRVLKHDARDLDMPAYAGTVEPPCAGLNVQLTLDMGIQTIVEEELDAGLERFVSSRGTIIILEPRSGEVLAMASRPHFDLNLRSNLKEANLNYATQAIYEPGSTFKIVAVSSALDTGLVRPTSSVFCCNGHYQEGAISIQDHHSYGTLTVEGVVQKSSNIGAYKLALQVGHARYFDYAQRFGFGSKTTIELSGENKGCARDSGAPVDFSRVAYGYAVSVTPLQVACAYAAVANGGKRMRPHIVRQVVANDGAVLQHFEPEVAREVLKPQTAAAMRKMLAMVVDAKGTAPQAKVPGFKPGGKTGTAVRFDPLTKRYQPGHYTVSFAGLMPAEEPAFVCVVVIDDPQTRAVPLFGGTIAAPVFAKIAERVAHHLNLQPTEIVKDKADNQLAEDRKR